MEYFLQYFLNILAVMSLFVPCCLLSIFFAWKRKPLAGGALALAKFFLTVRAAQIWEAMLRSSGKIGWRMFGFGYAPVGAILLMSMLVIGVICFVLNVYVFARKAMYPLLKPKQL